MRRERFRFRFIQNNQTRRGFSVKKIHTSRFSAVLTRSENALFHGGVMAPVEAAAENALDDQVVGCRGWPNAYADVDLPFGRDVQVGDGEDLLLLLAERVEA